MRILGCFAAAVALVLCAAEPAAAQTRVALTSGYEPDPWTVNVELRSRYNAPPRTTDDRGVPCLGSFNWVDVELAFTESNLGLPLIISAGSNVDTTLVVEDPYGRVYCDDDEGALGYNPTLTFTTPRTGRYRIWLGVYRNPETGALADVPAGATARISISELYSQ